MVIDGHVRRINHENLMTTMLVMAHCLAFRGGTSQEAEMEIAEVGALYSHSFHDFLLAHTHAPTQYPWLRWLP